MKHIGTLLLKPIIEKVQVYIKDTLGSKKRTRVHICYDLHLFAATLIELSSADVTKIYF